MATRYVALLRAINVGKRRMEMAKLRAELEAIGLDDVSTFIGSGNALFTSGRKPATLEPQIERCIEAGFGYLAEAFVRSADQIAEIVERRPFGVVPDGDTHLVAFLRSAPSAGDRTAIEALSGERDQLIVRDAEVHWHIAGKTMDSLLKPKDWKAAGAGLNTTRNITMLTKLAAKLHG